MDDTATTTTNLLTCAADRLLDLEYQPWQFGDSIAFEAMVDTSRATGLNRWRDFAWGFVRSWAASRAEFQRLDCTAPGLALLKLYKDTTDNLVLDCARRLADYLGTRPRLGDAFLTFDRSILQPPLSGERLSDDDAALLNDPLPGVYIDCLHFDPPLFVGLGQMTGDQSYLDEGVRQALAYIHLLQHPASGLFHHFALESPNGAKPFIASWGRGQGWALLGIADVLGFLPRDHEHWDELAAAARKLIDRMLQLQREDGSWHTLVDDSSSGAESSTAAFMETGMRRACELGIISADQVRGSRRRAREATIALVRAGVLRHASDKVNSSPVPSHYSHVPTDVVSPWSQGALVLALAGR